MKSFARLSGLLCLLPLALAANACSNDATEDTSEPVARTRQAVSQATKDACSFKYDAVASITAAPIPSAAKGFAGSGMVFADVTGDGKSDLVAVTAVDTITTYVGNGNGTFTKGPETKLPAPPSGKIYVGLGIVANADFDNDGKKDIALVSTTAFSGSPGGSWFGRFYFAHGSTTGALESLSQTADVMNSGNGTVYHLAQDFDGDGRADFFYGNYGGQSIMFSNAGRAFSAATSATIMNGNGGGLFANGNAIFHLSGSTAQKVTWNAARTKSTLALQVPAVSGGTSGTTYGDLDGDGKLELAGRVQNASPETVKIGTVDATSATSTFYGFNGYTQIVTFADVVGDGKKALLYVDDKDALFAACGYAPGATDLVAAPLGIAMPYGISLLNAGDINGDGKADFLTTKSGVIQSAWLSGPKPTTPAGQVTLSSTPPKPTDPTNPDPDEPKPPKKDGGSSGNNADPEAEGEGTSEVPADPGASTTKTTSGCAQAPASTSSSLTGLGLVALGLVLRARRRRS